MSELLPCPFCGKSNHDRWPCEWLDGSRANVIRCAWCHGAAPMNVWNRRTTPPSVKAQGGGEVVIACDCGANRDNRWPHHDECSVYAAPQPPAEAQAQGGGWCVERGGDPDFPQWAEVKELIVSAPPSAPVGVKGLVREYRQSMDVEVLHAWAQDVVRALTQQPAAVDGACAVAAIQFALNDPEGMTFLRLWNEGEFETLRREWPEAPSSIYVGADPLAQKPAAVDEAMVERAAKALFESQVLGDLWGWTMEEDERNSWREDARAIITAALAAQPGGES